MVLTLELDARLDNLLSTAQEETRDIDLLAPIVDREECPVCLQTLPIKEDEILFMTCCGKKVCCGCIIKNKMLDMKNGVPEHKCKCPFCRQPPIRGTNKVVKALKKLMKKNNPVAFNEMAGSYQTGDGVIQSDTKAFELTIRAAELGHANAYAVIGNNYRRGHLVGQDVSKALEYLEVAAKKGSIGAHNDIAVTYGVQTQIGIKHLKIVASAGHKRTLDILMKFYKDELLSKEELTQTLRAFQNSSIELKSKDRDDWIEMRMKAKARTIVEEAGNGKFDTLNKLGRM